MKSYITATVSQAETVTTTLKPGLSFSGSFSKPKMIRVTTVPESLKVLLKEQLRFMSFYFDIVAVSTPGRLLEEVGRREQVRTEGITMTRTISPLKDLSSLWKLYSLFRREKPVIVHTHTPKAGLLGMMAAVMAGVPVKLHTVAGLPLVEKRGLKKMLLMMMERITSLLSDKVYPNSKQLAEYMIRKKLSPARKIKVIGHGSTNGIDIDHFSRNDDLVKKAKEIKCNLSINESDFVFLYIGRLVKDKGINELVEAFTLIQKDVSCARLLLVGSFEQDLDPLSTKTINEIRDNDGIMHVSFQEDVRPFYILANVLTFPTYREGFPNVPMQAGCMELPSIVTDINGCNEIITHGKNGLIIPAKDVGALKKAMLQLINDPELYMSIKLKCRSTIVDRFDHLTVWKLILREYRDQLHKASVYTEIL